MERKEFIEKDPLTNNIVNLLRNNLKNSYSATELADILGNVSAKQVQLVINLLAREGMVKVSNKDGNFVYQIKP
jgi:predicted AAA+ superfamily ATPase